MIKKLNIKIEKLVVSLSEIIIDLDTLELYVKLPEKDIRKYMFL
jgi:hypothetical protein